MITLNHHHTLCCLQLQKPSPVPPLISIFGNKIFIGRCLSKIWVEHILQLNRYNIIFRRIFTSQNNTLEASRKDALCPLASSCQWFRRRDNHKHIVVSLDNSHHADRAAFFDVPTKYELQCNWHSSHEKYLVLFNKDALYNQLPLQIFIQVNGFELHPKTSENFQDISDLEFHHKEITVLTDYVYS